VVVRLRADLSGALVDLFGGLGKFVLCHRAERCRFGGAEFLAPRRSIRERDEIPGLRACGSLNSPFV
jgi:hypothetical protein